MPEKPLDKRICRQCHGLYLGIIFIIFVLKCDGMIIHIQQAIIGYGNPMCIPAKITNDPIRTGKWWLGIYIPTLLIQIAAKLFKPVRGGNLFKMTWKPEQMLLIAIFLANICIRG